MKPDLERALGLAHGVQAEYHLMASSAEEKQVKQVFESMADDLDRHIKVLKSRQEYMQKWGDQLQQGSNCNQGGSGQGGAGQGSASSSKDQQSSQQSSGGNN